MKKELLVAACFAVLTMIGGRASAAATWDMAVAYPPGNYQTQSAERFASEVAKATKGEVSIKVQPGGALGFKGPEMLGAIRDGLVPIGTMLLNQQVGVEPLLGIASLPYLVTSPAEMRLVTDIARPAYDRIAAKNNQKILYIIPWPGQNIFSKVDIHGPADFKNLKIRTVDRNGSDFFRSLGASPAQMPWGEVVPALSTGTINSVTTSSSSAVDGQFWDFMKFAYLVDWQSNFDMVTVNLAAWKKLSPDQQKAVEGVAKRLEPEFWNAAEDEDSSKLKLIKSKGMQLIRPSDDLRAFMVSKGETAWKTFAKDVPGAQEIIQKYRSAAKK